MRTHALSALQRTNVHVQSSKYYLLRPVLLAFGIAFVRPHICLCAFLSCVCVRASHIPFAVDFIAKYNIPIERFTCSLVRRSAHTAQHWSLKSAHHTCIWRACARAQCSGVGEHKWAHVRHAAPRDQWKRRDAAPKPGAHTSHDDKAHQLRCVRVCMLRTCCTHVGTSICWAKYRYTRIIWDEFAQNHWIQ